LSPVHKNLERGRYEMAISGATAFVTFSMGPRAMILHHAEVPAALRGQGAGARLAAGVLDAIRAEGLKVVPRCGFIADFIARTPAYQDLLAR
jgi:predicted GNAT family acetyltransferase